VTTTTQRWIPLATAALGILAALAATPLLFPAPARAASRDEAASRATTTRDTTEASTGGIGATDADLARVGAALLGVASFGAGALWLVRRVKGRPFARRPRKSLEILDTMQLGGQRSLAVARVYDRVYILGLAKESVSLIRELHEEEAGLDMGAVARRDGDVKPAAGAAPFRTLLKRLTAAPSSPSSRSNAEIPAAPRRAPGRRPTIAELEREVREQVEELL
jgi:flagellar biogenesis protein FliO